MLVTNFRIGTVWLYRKLNGNGIYFLFHESKVYLRNFYTRVFNLKQNITKNCQYNFSKSFIRFS